MRSRYGKAKATSKPRARSKSTSAAASPALRRPFRGSYFKTPKCILLGGLILRPPNASERGVKTTKKKMGRPSAKSSPTPRKRKKRNAHMLGVPAVTIAVAAASLALPTTMFIAMPQTITVGSFFTGMAGCHFSCQDIPGRDFATAFWVEKESVARKFLNANLNVQGFHDVCDPSFLADAPHTDFVIGGFPCQTFSQNGRKAGIDDPRGVLVVFLLIYVRRSLPRMVLLENVKNLMMAHMETLIDILTILKGIKDPETLQPAYFVSFRVLNSMTHGGIPHHRERVYIVAIRKLRRAIRFVWPGPIPCCSPASLLDRDRVKLSSYDVLLNNMPKGKTAQNNVRRAIEQVRSVAQSEGKHEMHYLPIVDLHSSALNMSLEYLPCLTEARGRARAFWSLAHGGPLSTRELLRFQAFPTDLAINVSAQQIGGMLGNAFTCSVVRRIVEQMVRAAEGRT